MATNSLTVCKICHFSIRPNQKKTVVAPDPDGTERFAHVKCVHKDKVETWARSEEAEIERTFGSIAHVKKKEKPGNKKPNLPLPVRKTMCATCPFRPNGWTEVRPLLEERLLHSTPICHSTGKALVRHEGEKLQAHACRGARNQQLIFWHRIGFIRAPTDEAWFAKLAEVQEQHGTKKRPASRHSKKQPNS